MNQEIKTLYEEVYDKRLLLQQKYGYRTVLRSKKEAMEWAKLRSSHHLVVGKSGGGKTVSIREHFMIDSSSNFSHSIFLDLKGGNNPFIPELLETVEFEAIAESGRLTLISPDNPHLGFNILDDEKLIFTCFEKIGENFTAPQKMMLTELIKAVKVLDGTLIDCYKVLVDPAVEYGFLKRLSGHKNFSKENLQKLIKVVFQGNKTVKSAIVNHLAMIENSPYLTKLICSRGGSLDLKALLTNEIPQVILIDLGGAFFGKYLKNEERRLVGQFLVAIIEDIAINRKGNEFKQIFFYIDEFQEVVNENTLPTILKTGRSRGLAMILITQTIIDLSMKTKAALSGAIGNFEVFQVDEGNSNIMETYIDPKSHPLEVDGVPINKFTTLPRYVSVIQVPKLLGEPQFFLRDHRQNPIFKATSEFSIGKRKSNFLKNILESKKCETSVLTAEKAVYENTNLDDHLNELLGISPQKQGFAKGKNGQNFNKKVKVGAKNNKPQSEKTIVKKNFEEMF